MDTNQAEKTYRWLEAAKAYEEKAQSQIPPSELAEIWERTAYCYSQASRQSANEKQFRKLRRLSAATYERAAEFYDKENPAKNLLCKALSKYTGTWVAANASEKKVLLEQCRAVTKQAQVEFKKSGDLHNFGKACNLLSNVLFDLLQFKFNIEDPTTMKEAAESSNEAIRVFSILDEKEDLLLAFSNACLNSTHVAALILADKTERTEEAKRCMSYLEKITSLLADVGDLNSKAFALHARAYANLYVARKYDTVMKDGKEMFNIGSTTGDNYFRGTGCYYVAYAIEHIHWTGSDPNKEKKLRQKMVYFAKKAIPYIQPLRQDSTVSMCYYFLGRSYAHYAEDLAIDERRRNEAIAAAEKTIRILKKGLKFADRSGSIGPFTFATHGLILILVFYSKLVSTKEEKYGKIKTALDYNAENSKANLTNPNLWTKSTVLARSAYLQSELSRLEEKKEDQVRLLDEATSNLDAAVKYCKQAVEVEPTQFIIRFLGDFEFRLGQLLTDLHEVTSDKESLTRANAVLEEAAETFKKVSAPNRVAECYWRIAKNQDELGDNQKAAGNFEKAFAGYKATAQSIPQLTDFYLNYATYMKAWSEISEAKRAHTTKEYVQAMQHYDRSAALFKESRTWSHLSPNFTAWSILEQAEDLSIKENCEESIGAFQMSIALLQESKRTLIASLDSIGSDEEKQFVAQLLQASDMRERYGRGRIAVEEAKILDRKGEHVASSMKYGDAASIFQDVMQMDSVQTADEVEPLIYLCQAWKKMTLAEAKVSPALYEEASKLFMLAYERARSESASLLALGHSNFCNALVSGTAYEVERDLSQYRESQKYLEAAANCYLRAGFEVFSDYARATQRLFDAYVFMENAKAGADPEKESKFYSMAEKVLQIAADSFNRARYCAKAEQVSQLIRRVQEEKQIALSLSQVLQAPTITSSTANFTTIRPTIESAVGLERFEHPDIQAKIVLQGDRAKVGDNLSFEIQLANVGKEPLFVTRIENIITDDFRLVSKPECCTVTEGRYLIVKGKRLAELQTSQIKFSIMPLRKGNFEIQPRIICADETGQQMACKPEIVTINVAENILPNRVPTGSENLDNLLLGGIPETYAVVLASPSTDESEKIVQQFTEAGAKSEQPTLSITADATMLKTLAMQHPKSFYLILCNIRSDNVLNAMPNIIKLKGMENLTDIEIAIAKALRATDAPEYTQKRSCITIVSDALLQHHAVTTRKWLQTILIDLKSKGFTTLATLNPQMHSTEEAQSILSLFEGEIRITEKETPNGIERVMSVRRLTNQRYLENEISLTKG